MQDSAEVINAWKDKENEFHTARNEMKREIARIFKPINDQFLMGDPADAVQKVKPLIAAIQDFTNLLKELFPGDRHVDKHTSEKISRI